MKASDLPASCRARNAAVLAQHGETVIPPMTDEAKAKIGTGKEAQLQRDCENGIRQRGFVAQTPDNAGLCVAGRDVRGTFVHLRKPQGNDCIVADLILFDFHGRYLQIELKVLPARYRPGQEEYIASTLWQLATSYDECMAIVDAWMREVE